jgi:signal transduction histidine kinase
VCYSEATKTSEGRTVEQTPAAWRDLGGVAALCTMATFRLDLRIDLPGADWARVRRPERIRIGGTITVTCARSDRETRLGHDLPLIRCDRVQLQQVLLNLIINAVEAMSGIKERPCELTIVSASDGPDTVSVEVRDSGTGLDPEHAPHLFEPFYTTKAEGLGIGLSISRSIVEAHGGRLSAAANAPHGTVFSVSLPVNEPAP